MEIVEETADPLLTVHTDNLPTNENEDDAFLGNCSPHSSHQSVEMFAKETSSIGSRQSLTSLRKTALRNQTLEQQGEDVEMNFLSEADEMEGMIGDSESLLASFTREPSKVDSLQRIKDLKLENVDITEYSLHQVAKDGDIVLMEALLKQRTRRQDRTAQKVNKKDADQFTPLHYAARYNHFGICQLLLQRGANIHARGEDALTPLHLVARYKPKKERLNGFGDGDNSDISSEEDAEEEAAAEAVEANLRVLDLLISSGAHINEKDFYGLTPLHHASLRGNDACVAKMLKYPGIAVEETDKQLMTPLHLCAVYGHVNIAKMLIDAGANVRCKEADDGTPLLFAAAEGHLEIIKLILNQCEKISQLDLRHMLDEQDNQGNTPLHLAVDNGHLEVTQYIIDRCLAIGHRDIFNARRGNKDTCLHIAARHGYLEIARLLVDKKAKINARNDLLQTPLFLAAQFDHHQVVDFLIKCKANIELHDSSHSTALLIAANHGHTATIVVLLQHKANVLAVDKNDKTIVYMCAEEDRVGALQELLKRNKILSLLEVTDRHHNAPLHAAAMNGHLSIVKMLLDAGAIIDAKNEDEQTALHLAASRGFVRIVKELVGRKKEIIHDDDGNTNSPLHLAALAGREQCVKELVRLGADIEARNTKQWTPLDCCAFAGMYKSALVLLKADSPVDPKDKRKITPLHLACQHGHPKMVELLLDWNADVTQRSVRGLNALDFAIEAAQTECAHVIIASDRWREVLQNRTYEVSSDALIDTPMRKLIRKMPSVASEVFRKCLRDNGKHKDDPNYEISFDYEFLDDEFSSTYWLGGDDDVAEVNVTMGEHNPMPVNKAYNYSGRVAFSARSYTNNSSILIANHPLSVMVKAKRVGLMRHPLVISLLNHKWRSYGRTVYYSNLMAYLFFMISLNSYMLTVPPPFAIDLNRTQTDGCVRVVAKAREIWGDECQLAYATWQPVAKNIIIVLAAFGLFKEVYQLLSKRSAYFKSVTNYVELSLYILAILTVIDATDDSEQTGLRENWQWECGSAALFFSWMGLILFIQNFPRFGIFVLMFGDVLRTFISFFFVFVLFILGFALSFHVLLQNQFAFNRWWNSIVKTFVMMIGEFDYADIFNAQFISPMDYTSMLHFKAITYLLFVVFMIIMSIIIMNLLVGLAVDDIKEVQNNAVLEGLAMQIKLALDIEHTLPSFVRRRFTRKYRKFFPNAYRKRHKLVRWLLSEEHLDHRTIDEALNPEKSEMDVMRDKIDVLQDKVRDLRGLFYGLNDRALQIENISQAIAGHFNIEWEKDEDDREEP